MLITNNLTGETQNTEEVQEQIEIIQQLPTEADRIDALEAAMLDLIMGGVS